jgi:hypothetical protein
VFHNVPFGIAAIGTLHSGEASLDAWLEGGLAGRSRPIQAQYPPAGRLSRLIIRAAFVPSRVEFAVRLEGQLLRTVGHCPCFSKAGLETRVYAL